MGRFFKGILVIVVVAGLAIGWALFLPLKPPPQPNGQATFVLLRPGWTTRHIARELKANGVIRSENAFLAMHILRGARSLKAGEYKFDGAESAVTVRDRLVRGDVYIREVTIPEGYNKFEVAEAVENAGVIDSADFLNAVHDDLFLVKDLDPQAKSLEGYLFPDTYNLTRAMTAHDIVAVMVHRFRQEAKQMNLTTDVHQVVTMASIVEKETADPGERPEVASVYYNRLRLNMPLAADPSVIYAALLEHRYSGTISRANLLDESPYNTYKHPGLPPGPIGNPGRASLEAAMHPANTDLLYFVADAQGHHRFARTLDEHNRNVALYRRALATGR